MTKLPVRFTFSSINSVNDLASLIEDMLPLLKRDDHGGYRSDKLFEHAEEWITLLRDFIRDNTSVEC